MIPSLLSPAAQLSLLSRLLHRDLSDERHKTNVHMHYDISYPPTDDETPGSNRSPPESSFFRHSPTRADFCLPKDPSLHKPLTASQFLGRKLRWMTLGGQYDWTEKVYPDADPPPFPSDIGDLLRGLFPETDAQAAIVNLYSPGDTLSLHRDVSEESEKGLISISIGCDAIFIVGLERNGPRKDVPGEAAQDDDVQYIALRLRSGDGVYMSGPARFAWHGVPKIIPDTCPDWMKEWPAQPSSADGGVDEFEAWRGWMGGKRINLNVRQMFDNKMET